jgi:hypothetical protein
MTVDATSSYSGRGILRNGLPASTLDRVFGEALAAEMTRCPEAGASSLDDPLCSSRFGLERGEGRLHHLFRNASPGQVVLDQGIACTSLGEKLGARSRETPVVNGAGPNQALHGLVASCRSDASASEPLGKLLLRQIAPGERARSPGHRLMPDELATQPPRPRPIELDTDVQSGRQHGLGRECAPMLTVQGDLDASPRLREQGANPWRRPLRGQLPPP